MKKNILRFFSFMLILAIAIPFISGCKEEDNRCKLLVIVQDVNDTSIRIPGATINISKGSGSVKANGVSDSKGEANFVFDNEAILDINMPEIRGFELIELLEENEEDMSKLDILIVTSSKLNSVESFTFISI